MAFTIVGSGFGLYGYLPAIFEAFPDCDVTLPLAYKAILNTRPELREFADKVIWRKDIEEVLNAASGVVVAIPPMQQLTLVRELLKRNNLTRIILEKPLAPTPVQAATILDALVHSRQVFAVNYAFVNCLWTKVVETLVRSKLQDSLALTWRFRAHHFARGNLTWKRRHAEGGGVLRFYGIHVIAWLAYLGFIEVRSSTLRGVDISEPRCWKATFARSDDETLTVLVDSDSELSEFSIVSESDSSSVVDLADPFALEPTVGLQDNRVSGLVSLLKSLDCSAESWRQLYFDTNVLWSSVEAKTDYISQTKA